MKNFLLIAFVVGMCDSCQGKLTEQSRFKSVGINNERDATPKSRGYDMNSGDSLPEFKLPEPRIKFSGNGNEQDIKIPYRDFKTFYYSIN